MSILIYIFVGIAILIILHIITLYFLRRRSKDNTKKDEKGTAEKGKPEKRVEFSWGNAEGYENKSDIVISLADLLFGGKEKEETSGKTSSGKETKKKKSGRSVKAETLSSEARSELKETVKKYITDDLREKLEDMGLGADRRRQILEKVKDSTDIILADTDMDKHLEEDMDLEEQALKLIEVIRPRLTKELQKIRK